MKLVHSLLAAAIAAASPVVGAATFTVTNLNDSGVGSLRDALAQANAMAGADTVQFQAGLAGTLTLTSGELAIADSTTVSGPGAHRVTIDANNAGRAFHLTNPGSEDRVYAISGLTVTNAFINSGNDDSGAGLFYEASSIHADITLSNMAFTGNTAGRKGGAVSVSGANLTLRNVAMTDNHAAGGFQPSGGALAFDRGLVRIERSRIVDNTAELNGGGIRLSSPGVNAVITDTLIQGNEATHTGGGMIADTMTSLTITRSAFVGNTTGQPYGGGLYFAGVTDAASPENVIENTTFSDNASLHQSGRGSALAIWQGNMTVRNSTFADNKTAPGLSPGENSGGALWLNGGATTKLGLQSTLFVGNTHGDADLKIDLSRNIASSGTQSLIDADHSSFEATPAIGVISGSNNANLFEIDPLLQPLTLEMGGITPVHPLPENSPVLEHGANPASLTTDQRGPGYPRAASATGNGPGVTDIGAFEFRVDRIFFGDFEQH